MNEQNIQNIVAYFTQNPSLPPESLVQNLLTSGYPRIDIDEAMTRLGMAPEVMPESDTQIIQQKKSQVQAKPFPIKLILIILGGIIVGGGLIYGGFIAFNRYQSSPTEPSPQLPNSQIPSVTKTPPTDPAIQLKQELSQGVYKITIDQTITDTDPKKNENSTLIYYIENGNIMRFEHSGGTALILRGDTLYLLNTAKKTYYSYIATAEQKTKLMDTVNEANIIRNFIENTEEGVYTWQKVGDYEWEGKNTKTNHQFDIEADGMTGLLKTVEEFDELNNKVSHSIITIEPVHIQDNIRAVPPDYTRVQYELK